MARFALPIFEFNWRIIADALIERRRRLGFRVPGESPPIRKLPRKWVLSGLATIQALATARAGSSPPPLDTHTCVRSLVISQGPKGSPAYQLEKT